MATIALKPTEVNDAAKKLDELADRLEMLMTEEDPKLRVIASGRDEVSTHSASTMNQVGDSFKKASDKGVNELREIAAALRKHSAGLSAVAQELL